jgi:MiaB-like tRNA modifying enzyme
MRVYIETYGCTANKSDESAIKGLLRQQNYELVSTSEDADVIILLTCTVVGTTEQRMLSRIRVLRTLEKPFIITGCMQVVQSDLIASVAPDAIQVSPQQLHHIPDLIHGRKPVVTTRQNIRLPKYFEGVTAPIAIAEGCLLSCSYCITHFARGQLISFPIQQILTDVHSALYQGCREIQLTAQDTASYGCDKKTNLGVLLREISAIKQKFRVRVGMMNPSMLQKNLQNILPSFLDSKIYKFLHLPVQSGDNTILQKMRRAYSVEEFKVLIHFFREQIPTITLATDIIVGFPTESREQFENTMQLLDEIKPDIVNITRYSARPYTPAKKMKGRIPSDIMKKRSKLLAEHCKNISEKKNYSYIGNHDTILITESGKNGSMVGRTNSYKPVVIQDQMPLGIFIDVEITGVTPHYLVGKLI